MMVVLWIGIIWITSCFHQVSLLDGDAIAEGRKCDIGFILDTSGSIHKNEYVKEKRFVTAVARHIGISETGSHYGVILFGQYATVDIKFTDYYDIDKFEKAVMSLGQSGSITRIDRGLLKAYNTLFQKKGGSRQNANKVLFLLTDGSQSQGTDVIDSSLIANNLRLFGVSFYVIGIGKSVNPNELVEIADGDWSSVFLTKSFNELISVDFINRFNISCGRKELAIQASKYHLKALIINNAKSPVSVTVTFSFNNQQDIILLEPSQKHYYEKTVKSKKSPIIQVSAISKIDDSPILANHSKYLTVNFGKNFRETVIYISDLDVQELLLQRVIFSIQNQLNEPIILKWFTEGKQNTLKIEGEDSLYYKTAYNYGEDLQNDIVFTAEDLSGKQISLNGKDNVLINVDGSRENYYAFLYTTIPDTSTGKLERYSIKYKVTNIGQTDVKVFGAKLEHQISAYQSIENEYTVIESSQPNPVKLHITRDGDSERYFLAYLLPTIRGNSISIFVGSDFASEWHYSYTQEVHNLLTSSATIHYNLFSHDDESIVDPGIISETVHMAYTSIVPARKVTGFFRKNGRLRNVFINNKPVDFIGPKHRNDVCKIIVTERTAKRYWFSATIVNKNKNDVVLQYSHFNRDYLLDDPPKSNITILADSTEVLKINPVSLATLDSIQLTAVEKESKFMCLVNNELNAKFPFASKKSSRAVTITITASRFVYYLNLNIFNDLLRDAVTIKWQLNSQIGSLQTDTPSSLTIDNGKKISSVVKFTSQSEIKADLLNKAVSLRATTVKDDEQVLVNGLREMQVNLREVEGTPVNINISHPGLFELIKDLSVINVTSSSITIRWKANPYARGYRIEARNSASNEKSLEAVKEIVTSQEYIYFLLNGLRFNQTYRISLQTIENGGRLVYVTGTTNPDYQPAVIKLQINNLWIKDILLKWSSPEHIGTDVYINGKSNKSNEIIFPHGKQPSHLDLQVFEKDTGLLLILHEGKDNYRIEPEPYQQNFIFDIKSVNDVTIYRSYYLFLKFTNFASQDAQILIRNISNDVLLEKQISVGEIDSIVDLLFTYSDFPLVHYVEIVDDGLYANGERQLSFIPLSKKLLITVYIGGKDDSNVLPSVYFINLNIENDWEKPVTLLWHSDFKLNKVDIDATKSKQKSLISFADETPTNLLLKIVDRSVEQNLKISGEDQLYLNYSKYLQPMTMKIDETGEAKIFKTYHLIIMVSNQDSNNVRLKWDDKEFYIKAGQSKLIKRSYIRLKQPFSVLFKAVTQDEEALLINNEKSVSVLPTLRQAMVVFNITNPPKNKKLTIQFINILEAQTQILLTNSLQTTDNTINGKVYKNISIPYTNEEILELKAISVATGERETLNDTKVFRINPTEVHKSKPIVLFVGATAGDLNPLLQPYYLNINFQNLNPEDVIIKWKKDLKEKHILLKAGEQKRYTEIFMGITKPESIEFLFIDKNSQDQLILNGNSSTKIIPERNMKEVDIVLDTVSTSRLYFINLILINTLPYQTKVYASDKYLDISYDLQAKSYQEKLVKVNVQSSVIPIVMMATTNEKKEYISGVKTGFVIIPTRNTNRLYLYVGHQGLATSLHTFDVNAQFFNNRTAPVSVRWAENGTLKSRVINPGKLFIYKTLLVLEKPSEALKFMFYDEKSSNVLLNGDKWETAFDMKLIKDNHYKYAGNIVLDSRMLEALYLTELTITTTNHEEVIANVSYNWKSLPARNIEVNPFEVNTLSLTLPVFTKDDKITFDAKRLNENTRLLINGKKKFDVKLTDRKINAVLNIKNTAKNLGSRFTILNTLNKPITIETHSNAGSSKKTVIPAGERMLFIIYMSIENDDRGYGMKVTATSTEDGFIEQPPVLLNGYKTFLLSLTDESLIKDTSLVASDGESDSNYSMAILDITNTEGVPVLLHQSVSSTSDLTIPSRVIDANERKRLFITFPNRASIITLRVDKYESNQSFAINRKYLLTLRPTHVYPMELTIRNYDENAMKYFYNVDVTNDFSTDVKLERVENATLYINIIPKGDRTLVQGIIKSTQKPDFVTLSASSMEENERNVMINGKTKLDVEPTLNHQTLFVILTDQENPSLLMKDFFVTLSVRNNLKEDVELFWQWNEKGYITQLVGDRKTILRLYLRSHVHPKPFELRGYTSKERVPVDINSKDSYLASPSDHDTTTPVFIDEKGTSMRTYHANLRLKNRYPLPVNLEWHVNKESRIFTIQPNEEALIKDSFRGNSEKVELIPFQAWDASSKRNILMNNRKLFKYSPTVDIDSQEEVILLPDENTSIYKAIITNNNDADIDLKWTFYTKKNLDPIEDSSLSSRINIKSEVRGLEIIKQYDRSADSIIVTAFKVKDGKQVYINGQLSVSLNETNKGDANHLIIGDDASEQSHYFKLIISNLYHRTAVINWTSNGEIQSRKIPPYYFNYVIKDIIKSYSPTPIEINSYLLGNEQKVLLINDKVKLSITPGAKSDVKSTNAFISSYVTKRTATLSFKNPTNNDIDVQWETRSFNGLETIPKFELSHNITIITNGAFRNQKVSIRALSDENGDVVVNSDLAFVTRIPYNRVITLSYLQKTLIINNTLNFDVVVSTSQEAFSYAIPSKSDIKVSIPGKVLRLNDLIFTAANKNTGETVPINGENNYVLKLDSDVSSLQIGAVSSPIYFVKLWLSNNHTRPVMLKWFDDDGAPYEVGVGFDGEHIFSFDANTVVTLSAIDVQTNKLVYINQRDELKIEPKKSNKYAISVVLNGEIYEYDYFYRLIVNNDAKKSVDIILLKDNDRREATVPEDEQNFSINSPLTNLNKGVRQVMKVYAYDTETNNKVFINEDEYVEIYPTLNDEDATKVVVNGKEVPLGLFYYSIIVSLVDNVNVLLKYNLNGESKFIRIPAKSQNYIASIPVKSFRLPNDLQFTAVNENTNERLSINNAKYGTMVAMVDKDSPQSFKISKSDNQEVTNENQRNETTKHSYKAIVNNPLNEVVYLTWKIGSDRLNVTIPKLSFQMQIRFNFSTNSKHENIEISAINIETDSLPGIQDKHILINNNKSALLPKCQLTMEIPVLNLSLAFVNPIKIYFRNHINADVTLSYEVSGRTQQINVPSKNSEIEMPANKRIIFTSGSEDVLLNGKAFYEITSDAKRDHEIVLERRKYEIQLVVRNLLARNAFLNWTVDEHLNKTLIPMKSETFRLNLHTSKKELIVFNAFDDLGKSLVINNVSFFALTPTNTRNESILSIDEPLKTFYYNIRLRKNNNLAMTLICNVNNGQKIFNMNENEKTMLAQFQVQARKLIENVSCNAINLDSGREFLLNHHKQMEFQPTLNANNYIDVSVGPQLYYSKLLVSNALPVDVGLVWSIGNETIKYIVKENAKDKLITINTPSNEEVILKGLTNEQRPILLNNLDSFTVYPEQKESNVTLIEINSITFYYVVQVENTELYEVVVHWNLNGKDSRVNIKGLNSQKMIVEDNSVNQPSRPLTFKAIRSWRGKRLLINNENGLVVQPQRNKLRVSHALISSTPRDLNAIRFITVTVTNLVQDDVTLKWFPNGTNDASPQYEVVKKKSNQLLMTFYFDMNASPLVRFSGFVKNKNRDIQINKQNFVSLEPQKTTKIVNLILTDQGSLKSVYLAHVEIQNHHYNPITIEYRQAGVKEIHSFDVPPSYHKWYNLAYLKPPAYPLSIEFKAYDAIHYALLKMNYQISVLFQPKRKQETLTLSIGDAVPQEKRGNQYPAVRDKVYFFGIHVINDGNTPVMLRWLELKVYEQLEIPPKGYRTYMSLIKSNSGYQPWVAIRATNRVRINGEEIYFVRTSASKQMNYLYVNAEERHLSDHQYYYYGVKIENLGAFDVDVRWVEGAVDKTIKVKSTEIETFHNVIRSLDQPDAFTMRAYRSGTMELVLMNFEERIKISPSRRNVMTYIRVEPKGNSTLLKNYFVGFDVKNLLNHVISLKWNERGDAKALTVNSRGSQHYDTTFLSLTQPRNIVITAYNKNNNELLSIYGEESISITPTLERGRVVFVVDSEGESNIYKDYFLTIQVFNKDDNSLILQWVQDDTPMEFQVPPKSVVRRDVTVRSVSQPLPIDFYVKDKQNNRAGKINGLKTLPLELKRDGYFAHVYISTNGAFRPGQINQGQSFCKRKLDIVFLLDSSGTMKVAYQYAQQFIALFSEYFQLGSDETRIGVITFSEDAQLAIPLDKHTNHKQFQRDVYDLPFVGYRTRIDLAFKMADEKLFSIEREGATKLLILMTDGRQTHSNDEEQLKKAYDSSLPLLSRNVQIVAVGLFGSLETDVAMLTKLTRNKQNVYLIEHSPDLLAESFLEGITQSSCPGQNKPSH